MFSPLKSGNRVSTLGSPGRKAFSRSARSSLKRLPLRATSVRLMTFKFALVRILGADANAVADLEIACVHQGDFLVKPVGVFRESAPGRKAPW